MWLLILLFFEMLNNIIRNQSSMEPIENQMNAPLLNFANQNQALHLETNQFYQFLIPPPIMNQLFQRVNRIQYSIRALMAEIEDLKKSRNPPTQSSLGNELLSQNSQDSKRPYRNSKEFPKHLSCPSQNCRRRYSSKIALRAHLRKCHEDIPLS